MSADRDPPSASTADAHAPGGRLMLLTKRFADQPAGGRRMLCQLNYDILRTLFRENLVLHEIEPRPVRGAASLLAVAVGHIDGLTPARMRAILAEIDRRRVTRVFIDGSNLGAVACYLRQRRPGIEITTFFHNVEARFFWGATMATPLATPVRKLRASMVMLANYTAEAQAVWSSHQRICLSQRDSRLLRLFYGRAATHISPMALADQLPHGGCEPDPPAERPFALFVGGGFYANRDGIGWLADEVMPHVDVPVYVVGRGIETQRERLERQCPGRLHVVGAVQDLGAWYRQAAFVVAPIHDGSGMKTKVAEALMHGKKIVGTPEAFCGYDAALPAAGWVCRSARAFVAAMRQASQQNLPPYDEALRRIYLSTYSMPAALENFRRILMPV